MLTCSFALKGKQTSLCSVCISLHIQTRRKRRGLQTTGDQSRETSSVGHQNPSRVWRIDYTCQHTQTQSGFLALQENQREGILLFFFPLTKLKNVSGWNFNWDHAHLLCWVLYVQKHLNQSQAGTSVFMAGSYPAHSVPTDQKQALWYQLPECVMCVCLISKLSLYMYTTSRWRVWIADSLYCKYDFRCVSVTVLKWYVPIF